MREPEWTSKTYEQFLAISSRDQEAPEDWGQRVQQCVDLADFVINNDNEVLGEPAAKDALRRNATDFLQLCAGQHRRRPNPDELYMHLAYAASAGSACLKRNVGAIVVRPGELRSVFVGNKERQIVRQGVAISTGYNENPDWMSPCFIEYNACFRDIWRKDQFKAKGYRKCPYCGTDISNIQWPFKCPKQDCRRPLLDSLFPERAMTKCTAIHAEARALRVAGDVDLTGYHMFSTTCPCFLCAEQILQAGISRVVYVESYPDLESERLLRDHGVVVERFSGVKSLAFGRIFGDWRAEAERRYMLKP